MSESKTNNSRRSVLKKMGQTSVFVVPTIATFKLSELTARASGLSTLQAEPNNPYTKK